MARPSNFAGLISLVGAMLWACNAPALGMSHDKKIDLNAFDRVFVSGAATVELTQGSESALFVSGSPEALAGLVVDSANGNLFIDTEDHSADDLVIRLTFEQLSEVVTDGRVVLRATRIEFGDLVIEGKGSSSIELNELVADEIQVAGFDAAKFSLSGQVDSQVINIDGNGAYRAEGLSSRSVEVSVSGVGDVALWVKEMLDVEIAGAARVRYTGTPFVTQRVVGVGSVHRVGQLQI